MNAFKGALSGANHSPIIKSFNSLKEIGCDIWNGFKNRGEKALDSPYDFANWLALGIPGAIKATLQSNEERSEKAFNSVYDFTNWLSFGAADMVKGAVNPEDPFSKEHWLDSFGVVTTILGVRKATISKGKTSMLDDIPRSSKITKGANKIDDVSPSSKVAKGGSNPEKQLLSGSEWDDYFRQTYGSENVDWVTKNKSNFGLEGTAYDNLGNLNGKTPATRVADKFRGSPASKRPNTVATIRTKDGKYIIGRNSGGVLNDKVQEALDIVGINEFEGQCAEVNALSRAMNKRIDLDGATISVSNVRGINSTNGVHGTFKKPCSTCEPLLEYFKIPVNKGGK